MAICRPQVMRCPISPRPPVSEFGAPTIISGSSALTSAGIATEAAPAIRPFSPVLRVMFMLQSSLDTFGGSHPQIGAPYEIRVLQHMAVAGQYDMPVGKNDSARRKFEAGGVLLNEQNRRALPLNFGQTLEYQFSQNRRQAKRRLVQHQQLWKIHHGAPDSEHLLLAAR